MNTNDIVNGKVSHVAKSYALIEIESAGKIGLLHVTEMRGGSRGARSARLAALQPGWDVTVEVLKIEGESGKERISLSERSIQDRCVQEELQPGQEVTGKVADVREYGAIVELETPCVSTGLKALLHASQLPGPGRRERDEYLKRFKAGDAITAEVVSIEQRDGELRIGLSLVAAEQRKLKAELTGEGVGNAPVYKGTSRAADRAASPWNSAPATTP